MILVSCRRLRQGLCGRRKRYTTCLPSVRRSLPPAPAHGAHRACPTLKRPTAYRARLHLTSLVICSTLSLAQSACTRVSPSLFHSPRDAAVRILLSSAK